MTKTTLFLDIGSGTQDVLLYQSGEPLENCPKFVLPSPAKIVATKLKALTTAGKHVWLYGRNMGGGFSWALDAHLKLGLRASATYNAAYSLNDDLTRIEKMGVNLCEKCPEGYIPLELTDFDHEFWRRLLEAIGLDWPNQIVAAAQDHGFYPDNTTGNNRHNRFLFWKRLLINSQGRPESLIFATPPPEMTRLLDLQACIDGGFIADTGVAAVLGALFDKKISEMSQEKGIRIINIGNGHTIAFLLFQNRIKGIYEHHTDMLDVSNLWDQLERFRLGTMPYNEVFDTGGHGCIYLESTSVAGDFSPTYVLGPRRELLNLYPVNFPNPGGDTMLTGCLGLLHGLRLRGLNETLDQAR